eukprot:839336-Rhodomonas_salina.1
MEGGREELGGKQRGSRVTGFGTTVRVLPEHSVMLCYYSWLCCNRQTPFYEETREACGKKEIESQGSISHSLVMSTGVQ